MNGTQREGIQTDGPPGAYPSFRVYPRHFTVYMPAPVGVDTLVAGMRLAPARLDAEFFDLRLLAWNAASPDAHTSSRSGLRSTVVIHCDSRKEIDFARVWSGQVLASELAVAATNGTPVLVEPLTGSYGLRAFVFDPAVRSELRVWLDQLFAAGFSGVKGAFMGRRRKTRLGAMGATGKPEAVLRRAWESGNGASIDGDDAAVLLILMQQQGIQMPKTEQTLRQSERKGYGYLTSDESAQLWDALFSRTKRGVRGLGSSPEVHTKSAGYHYGSAQQWATDAVRAADKRNPNCDAAFSHLLNAAEELGSAQAHSLAVGADSTLMRKSDGVRVQYKKAERLVKVKCLRTKG